MIVRIFGDEQYRLADGEHSRLHELDHECVAAVEAGDADRFHRTYAELLQLIRTEGERLAPDELLASDLMLPPEDISLAEAGEAFHGEGLLPG
ncbi:MAG: hypothetical protein NVS1B9_06860 [Solirubrobacteraceae bacterium]